MATNKPKGFVDGMRRNGDKWEIRVRYKHRLTGEWKAIQRSGFDTKQAAKKAMTALKADLDNGRASGTAAETVAQFLTRYLDRRGDILGRNSKTWSNYESKMRHHVIPRIGNVRLDALTPAHIDGLQHDLLTTTKLSATSIRQTLTILRTALEHARKVDLLIPMNPVDVVERIPAKQYRPQQPAPEQVVAFLNYLRETRHHLYPAFLLLCHIGCRQGEVLALKWSDFDPEQRTVTIRRSRTQGARGTIEKESRKSGNDYAIAIDPTLWDFLIAHQQQQRAAAGNVVRMDGYVFTDREGDPLPGNALTGALRYLKPRTGLTCRLHDFRGFVTSQLFALGFSPAEVRDIGGWRDASTPLKHYSQPTPGHGRKAMSAIADLLRDSAS